ncbi:MULTISPECIES: lactonase family protein [Acetobacter]|uniref:lactonase family protein n=1 Tax=Acetobacter TaxID=434 RepID=UPI000A39988C|nr:MULTISPECIES: lactonase family protein [Acetobacter]MBS0959570.1 lactonase family protein [Acetobacter thailandicus]MBS0979979.1 lactonase family protein [Acetobacter thailandicus]MBS0985274.1 lactonase family protein [Acetobacter thailandicus]MBS1002701.1 lactonase family protein [Acetobacter thailandicus]OUI88837.1 3-carboxymuconate cyclase [Acetobacter sp. DmW_043]
MKNSLSRRLFGLGGLAGVAVAGSHSAFAADDTAKAPEQDTTPSKQKTFCYLGAYTKHGPPGGNGAGITVFEMNSETGSLTNVMTFTDIDSPSYIVLSPDKRFLYAVSEVSDFDTTHSGSVTAFSVNHETAALTKLNTVASGGADPAYVSVHPSGRYVFIANYTGGTVSVIHVLADGSLGHTTELIHDSGPRMPDRAADNPTGNFAVSDHSSAHPHMVQADPTGKFVLVADAGLDRMYVWTIDLDTGHLKPAAVPFTNMTPGSAPRHFCFSSDGRRLYILCEQDSKVVVADFDPDTGKIAPRQTVSTVTAHFKGSTLAAGIVLSPDERFLYVSNRLGDSLAVFQMAKDGGLTLVDEIWTHADYGRALSFDPSGSYLYVANQRSDTITSFRVDKTTGKISFTWDFTPAGSPTCFAFLRLPAA